MDSGVKVVGAEVSAKQEPNDEPDSTEPTQGESDGEGDGSGHGPRETGSGPRRRRVLTLYAVAIAGIVGTLVFGLLWATGGSSSTSDTAVITSASAFLNDLTNFNASSVDKDFGHITAMATGQFSTQANQFFNSAIRTDLEKALAESRGQIRSIYVQNDGGGQASVYAVVDQEYANNKISTPQTDVLRVVVNLTQVGSTWKISDVTVLEGATPISGSSSSGSAGSAVPGQ
jgi:hypothetical protein